MWLNKIIEVFFLGFIFTMSNENFWNDFFVYGYLRILVFFIMLFYFLLEFRLYLFF